MLEEEQAFVQANRDLLRENYRGKGVLIVGSEIIAAYDDAMEAYQAAIKTYQPGHFMIKEIPARPEDDRAWLSPFEYVQLI